jgi:hypothetical protein
MKTFVAAAGAALFTSVLLLPFQTEAQNAAASGIPGFLNPSTGQFTAKPALSAATPALQRSGTITVTVSVVFGSNIPASTSETLSCTVSLSAGEDGYYNTASGSGTIIRKGNEGTCKVSIPYIFEIAVATTPMNVSAYTYASSNSTPSENYSAEFYFSPFAVPNGNKDLAVTLAM